MISEDITYNYSQRPETVIDPLNKLELLNNCHREFINNI